MEGHNPYLNGRLIYIIMNDQCDLQFFHVKLYLKIKVSLFTFSNGVLLFGWTKAIKNFSFSPAVFHQSSSFFRFRFFLQGYRFPEFTRIVFELGFPLFLLFVLSYPSWVIEFHGDLLKRRFLTILRWTTEIHTQLLKKLGIYPVI